MARAAAAGTGRRAAWLVCLAATRAFAAADPEPLRFDAAVDGTVLAGATFAFFAANQMTATLIPQPVCDPCLAEGVNPVDRSLAGRVSAAADGVSWGLAALLLAAPLVADGVDVGRSGGSARSWGADAGVYLEALAIDAALNEVIKLAARRPRPFTYSASLSASDRAASDSYVSFYSEHSSLAFTAAAAYATTFVLRHRDRPGLSAAVALLGFGLASATAALRVVAGKHFYTDVIVGSAVGGAIGIAVPVLHRRRGALRGIAIAPLDDGRGRGALALFTWTS